MNEEDKKRFARYRPGWIEPEESQSDNETNEHVENKNKLGYIDKDKIMVNQDELVKEVITNKKLGK
jgi:hypothetical protein